MSQQRLAESLTGSCHDINVEVQTIVSGMGELHLDIYMERIRREYKASCLPPDQGIPLHGS